MTRVVSLVPSITETLLAWGVEPVAVTRFCDAPGRPRVGGTKNPDIDAIRALGPDLVVMDRQENRREDAAALEAAGVPILATDVRGVEDVAPALRSLWGAIGRAEAFAWAEPDPAPLGREPIPVWVPIWRRPWMTIGGATYGSSLLAAAGLDNVYGPDPDPYPTVSLAGAAAHGPAAVLAPSEPYKFTVRQQAELEQVAPVVFVDGRDLFWWGSRTPEALLRLRDLAATLARR